MKNLKKIILSFALIIVSIFCSFTLSGCFNNEPVSIVSVTKTNTVGLVDTYTITYSDGKTSTFTVTNGKNGIDGKDGADFNISKVYEQYVETYGEISYQDFLKQYLTVNENSGENIKVINSCLQSSMKVYAEFIETISDFFSTSTDTNIYTGSAIIYKIESEYSYIITNYHVVYSSKAAQTNGSNIARKIKGYLYGSEGYPVKKEQKEDGYTAYDYGNYAINMEYVGGSITNDIAIMRAKTADVFAVNPNAKAVTLAETYYVGETAIAIGNPEDEGISVTEGIVSVDNENIQLAIDNTTRSYRSIRIDTAIYTGNSGGGLYNSKGQLIGITNAGDSADQNVNYAIPLPVVKNTIENILHYYKGDGVAVNAHKIKLGITVMSKNSKYTYNEVLGYGKITENVVITEIENSCIAKTMQLQTDDIIKSIFINNKEYTVDRSFNISDIILNMRVNDVITIKVVRNNTEVTCESYTITNQDIIVLE